MRTEGKIGIDWRGIWTPAQYIDDNGWGYESVEATASQGVADDDAADLTADQCRQLLEHCKERVEEHEQK